jgi:hypothetical protein
MSTEPEPEFVAIPWGAYAKQIMLLLYMLCVIATGYLWQLNSAFGVSGWLVRAGLVVVGSSIIADFLDKSYGMFTGTTNDHFWQDNHRMVRKTFSWITVFGAAGGTLLSAFGDLLLPGGP